MNGIRGTKEEHHEACPKMANRLTSEGPYSLRNPCQRGPFDQTMFPRKMRTGSPALSDLQKRITTKSQQGPAVRG